MQKLTLEQRNWILKKFKDSDWREFEDPSEWPEEILDSCTEKPFPDLSLMYGFIHITHDPHNKDKFIKFSVGDCARPLADRWMTKKEFEDFVKECNRIVEWLDAHY